MLFKIARLNPLPRQRLSFQARPLRELSFKMSVPPKFSSHVLTFGPSSSSGGQHGEAHTLEFYLDVSPLH